MPKRANRAGVAPAAVTDAASAKRLYDRIVAGLKSGVRPTPKRRRVAYNPVAGLGRPQNGAAARSTHSRRKRGQLKPTSHVKRMRRQEARHGR